MILYCDVCIQREVERLQQSEARNNTAIQSLRQRLTEVEDGNGGAGTGQSLTKLQTEIGRLKKALNEKVAVKRYIIYHIYTPL